VRLGGERRSRRAAPRRAARWATLAGAALAGLLLGSLLFEPLAARLAPREFALETASVVGAHRITAEELVKASGVVAGTSALALDPAAVSARLASHPWISEARVTTFLFRRLLVAIVEREATAVVEIGPRPPRGWWMGAARPSHLPPASIARCIPASPASRMRGRGTPIRSSRRVSRSRAPSAGASFPRHGASWWEAGIRAPSPSCGSGPASGGWCSAPGTWRCRPAPWVLKADLAELGQPAIDLRFGSRVILETIRLFGTRRRAPRRRAHPTEDAQIRPSRSRG
jgi:hypothetical protein